MILKDEPSLVLRTPNNDNQIVLALAVMPRGEAEFKKYFKVSTIRIERQNQMQICIGCHVLSNRSLGNIKFCRTDSNLLAWLKKEQVFLESDQLGINRPVMIGYFTKIAGTLMHLANFQEHLVNQLMMVEIEADLADDLVPHLKQARLNAMLSGDEFVPILPAFKIYHTHLSHGCDPSQVSTEVLGVKSAPQDAKLLSKFFMRLAFATNNKQCYGVFIPKGTAYLLSPKTYKQILRDNNFFLTTVAEIPVNLAYSTWFAVIDPNQSNDTKPVSLYDHLVCKPWFLRIELVAKEKCLLITTKRNLPEARNWIDANLEMMIRKSIPQGIDLPSSLLPQCLNKPMPSASSLTYVEILKKQFSLALSPTSSDATNNQPPHKRHATILDYDLDHLAGSTATTVASTITNHSCTMATPSTPYTTVDYAAELQLIKTELAALHTLINSAVEQMKSTVKTNLCHSRSRHLETWKPRLLSPWKQHLPISQNLLLV